LTLVQVTRGERPIVLGLPHTGTHVPEPIWECLNDRGRALTDTDWRIERLYDDLLPDVTVVRATTHRYVIDVNRDPSGASLYPGRSTTDLVPLTDFEGQPIWTDPPTDTEVAERTAAFHAPYHAALAAEIERVRARHGVALLWDAHSIRSRLPRLFEGELPQFNLGTHGGLACTPSLAGAIESICDATGMSRVTNGRFRGGWITRHYGKPDAGVHAVQMELAMRGYLQEPGALNDQTWPAPLEDVRAARLRVALRDILSACIHFAEART